MPEAVAEAARRRSEARAARDWETADRLRSEIEAAGWKILDRGAAFRLEPAHPPDTVEGAIVRHGRSDAVPSLFAEPDVGLATLVVVAGPADVSDVPRALAAIERFAPAGTSVVLVADGLDAAGERPLEEATAGGAARPAELVRTSARLGHAAALNVGLRRACGPAVVVMDPSVEPTGDVVTPLVRALDDETVAVAGAFGLVSADLRHFSEVEDGDAAAIEGYLMAFRRADAAERGPLDEHFRFYRNLDIWWSLVLRDGGDGARPRTARVVPNLPLVRHENRAWSSLSPEVRDRRSKRNFYRILDRFGRRPELAVGG